MAITITTENVTEITSTTATSGATMSGDDFKYEPLVDLLLKNKFKIYNSSKQRVVSQINGFVPMRPFQIFEDSEQADKQFVLVASEFSPATERIRIALQEYDDVDINLI